LEVFRSLIGIGFRPTRPVEFHWYSAEEAGLLGSQDVAESYEKKGVEVIAMIQVSRQILLPRSFFVRFVSMYPCIQYFRLVYSGP
jgi:hypothetical protein